MTRFLLLYLFLSVACFGHVTGPTHEVENEIVISKTGDENNHVHFSIDNFFGGFSIYKNGVSGFMSYMGNSETPQIIFGSPTATTGVNITLLDSDNQGSLRLNTFSGAGQGGEVVASCNAPLRPDIDNTSDLGRSDKLWKKTFTTDLRVDSLAAGVVKSDSSGDISSETINTGFNKNFGTVAGTVSEGDHSHAGGGFNREYAESLGVSSTTASGYQQKLRLTTTSLPAGDYIISWSSDLGSDDDRQAAKMRVQLDDTTDLGESLMGEFHDQEDTYTMQAGFAKKTLSGVHTIDVDFAINADDSTANIRNVRILLEAF